MLLVDFSTTRLNKTLQKLPVGLSLDEIGSRHHIRGQDRGDEESDQKTQKHSFTTFVKDSQAAFHPLKLESVQKGQVLALHTHADRIMHGSGSKMKWSPLWNRLRSKNGVVRSVNVNTSSCFLNPSRLLTDFRFVFCIECVNMEFPDTDLGVYHRLSVPLQCLHWPLLSYDDPIEDLNIRADQIIEDIRLNGLNFTDVNQEIPTLGVGSYLQDIESALAILQVSRISTQSRL